MREFATGATRNTDDSKLDYEGFFDPLVLQEFAKYMHQHRTQADGKLRSSDNWQKGMPAEQYVKSLIRHVMDLWILHDTAALGYTRPDGEYVTVDDALGGIMFNTQGYWREHINPRPDPERMSPRELEADL